MKIQQRNVGPIVFLDLKGRFVLGEEPAVQEAVNRELLKGRRQFVLNLEEVTHMDTSGLSAMIAVQSAVRREDGQVKLARLPRRIYDLLVLTKLITLFEVVPSEGDAISSFPG